MRMTRRVATLGIALMLVAPACGGGQAEQAGQTGQADEDGGRGLTVLAAASLTDVFQSLQEPYKVLHPSVEITYSFGSSSTLVEQVKQGVEAGLVATADEKTMGELVRAEQLEERPQVFALNSLTIIVEQGNPLNVQGLSDLAREDLKVVLAAEEVPAGAYARQSLDAANVDVKPVSLEEDVKAVVSKVSLGEADAGIVYVTDAKAAGDAVDSVPIPEDDNVVARYPIVALDDDDKHSEDFIALVLSEDGRKALAEAGFDLP
jgi:molybdate transport system substrate-binding protein